MYFVCVENDTLYRERERCYSKFYQFVDSAWHCGIRVVRAYGEYDLNLWIDIHYGSDYGGTVLLLLEVDIDKAREFADKLKNLTNFPDSNYEVELDSDASRSNELIRFMERYDLSFEQIKGHLFGFECINRILLGDYAPPSGKREEKRKFYPVLLGVEGIDFPAFHPRPADLETVLSYDSEEEAEASFVFNLMRIWKLEDTRENPRPYYDVRVSHRVNADHPSILTLQSIFEFISCDNDTYEDHEDHRKEVFKRASMFLPDLTQKRFDQEAASVVADCLISFMDNEIDAIPESKNNEKRGFLKTSKPYTEEELSLIDKMQREYERQQTAGIFEALREARYGAGDDWD